MLKAIAIFGITSSIAAGLLGGPFFFAIAAAATIALAGFLVFRQMAVVAVAENEVAVVMSDGERRFSRFLPAGAHYINPFSETVTGTIATTGRSVRGKTEQIQTAGGLPVTVHWGIKFSVHPQRIKAEKAPKLARTLAKKADDIVADHLQHILHHALESYTIEALCQPGVHEKLERTVRQQLQSRLSDMGFKFSRIMIESIVKPAHVIQALEAAHERQIQAEQETAMLSRLQQVVSRFSDEDMRRLVELERIHAMGRNGVTMMMPADQFGTASRPRQRVVLDPFSN